VADPESVFHRYRQLIALRHDRRVVVEGDVEFLWLEHEQVFAYVRRLGSESLLVVANLSDQPAAIPADEIAGFRGAQCLVGQWSLPDSGPAVLGPWESAALLAGSGT
jgi:oligo-1,6-glucosidase